MSAKPTNDNPRGASFLGALKPSRFRRGPAAASLAVFTLVSIFVTGGPRSDAGTDAYLREFEVGRPADRDVTAEYPVSYIDEEATRLRREAQEALVPAVFRYSDAVTQDALEAYGRFSDLVARLFRERASAEAFKLALQADHPGTFPKETLDALFRNPGRERFLDYGAAILRLTLEGGVFALPQSGLEAYNPDTAELERQTGARSERERINYTRIVTLQSARERIAEIGHSGTYPSSFGDQAPALLYPFLLENVFFSPEETRRHLAEVRSRVEPVIKRIERGDRIIKKGAVVATDDLVRLRALSASLTRSDPGRIVGQVLVLLLSFGLLSFLSGRRVTGRSLKPAEVYLLAGLSGAYLVAAVFAGRAAADMDFFPAAIFLPTSLVVMLPAILIGPRVAAAVAVALPLAAFGTGALDSGAFIFAVASGIAGVYAMQGAERRMDLVKAGLVIALANGGAAIAVLLLQRALGRAYPPAVFWAAFNGMAGGMLALGFLPLLEQALNTATSFRLIELSDLNSPMLKRLLIAAPGTYAHSVTVANLAESACREIGADSLLARVGAYYHDIGKMDQPDYFIENQTAYNRHEDLAPRISAMVIRSHVKVGMEKAYRLGLPREVVDIIAEHHGNSVISWFYNEALKHEDQVKTDDFSYPGSPPRSRESAVVMLADTVEAAVRTLKKPTMSRLEKFVQELIMTKFEQGQLAEAELTFRDLEAIKKAFVRVLAGHYHSRIEYPKPVRELQR